ncbi:MAG: MFS transporter [Prochlorotrichaceae cyanobacterium]
MKLPPESPPESKAEPPRTAGSSRPAKVLWLQVFALAGVQGAIVAAWVIYNLYLASLLQQFGFSPGVATTIVFLENLLAALVEPIVGGLSDLSQRWLGSRFPLIAVGIVLSAAFFFLIPLFWVLGRWDQGLGWIRMAFPVILVCWALAMTLFRSPVLSLLGRYALNRRLPQAASFLTLIEGFARGWGFLASTWILSLGPVFAFGIGSILLLLGAIVLLLVDPEEQVERVPKPLKSNPVPSPERVKPPPPKPQKPLKVAKLGWVLGTGVAATLGFRLLFISFSQVLQQLPLAAPQANLILGMLFLSLSLSAIPLGKLAVHLGNHRSFLLGLTMMAGLCAIVPLISTSGFAVALAIVMGVALGLINNSALPFALKVVPEAWASLGTAFYFSGGSIAATLLTGALAKVQSFQPATAAFLGSGAFLLAGFFVASAVPLTGQKSGKAEKETV